MEKQLSSNWKNEFLRITTILKNNGIDIKKIPTRKTVADGKRVPTLLKDINSDKVDINKIIIENNLDENYKIGHYITVYRNAYNGTKGSLTPEEIKKGIDLGILVEHNNKATKPIFKGRKISQFHLDYINGILEEILSGKINTVEALNLLKQACIENNETIINDAGTIKRCIALLLKDRPEEYEEYKKNVKKNSGNRNPYKGKIGKPKIGAYHKEEEKFKVQIIEHYLPLIIKGEITFEMIEKELNTSHHTFDKIIEEYFIKNKDSEGLEKYQNAKKKNAGVSLEKREKAKKIREEVSQYNIVAQNEFVLLSPEEQEKQLIMKIMVEDLKEEESKTSSRKSAVVSEDKIKNKIDYIKDYFKSKNNSNLDKEFFSDDDIRFMIFRYPTLINRSKENLDGKIETLISYDEINEETAYGMIKTFPAIIGYDASRTQKQLNLLEKENLIDAVISNPRRLMLSVDSMYALIQFAKERHNLLDLSEVNSSNIFINNSILKRVYKTSFDEIKTKYPYGDDENIIGEKNVLEKIVKNALKSGITMEKVTEAIKFEEELNIEDKQELKSN